MNCVRAVDLLFTFLLERLDYRFMTAFLKPLDSVLTSFGAFDICHNDWDVGRYANVFSTIFIYVPCSKTINMLPRMLLKIRKKPKLLFFFPIMHHLDCKEMKPLNPKGKPWIFIGRTYPIVWIRDMKTCIPVADSCWYMAKPVQYCKVKKYN